MSEQKHTGTQKKTTHKTRLQKKKNLLWNLITLLAILVLAISLWQLSDILLGYHQAGSTYDEIADNMEQQTVPIPTKQETEPEVGSGEDVQESQTASGEMSASETEESTEAVVEETEKEYTLTVPDFAQLQSINPDVIGWIQIPGTRINYPVVQGDDNDYYLNHTVKGEENSSGAIFMDANITNGFQDKNPIIYGHNMKSGDMFSRLNRYARAGWWDTYRYVYVTTPEGGLSIYEVFSAYQTTADADIYYFGFGEDEYFESYVNRVMSYSIYNAGISVSREDSIITLSTCANDTTQRFIVHAKKVQ